MTLTSAIRLFRIGEERNQFWVGLRDPYASFMGGTTNNLYLLMFPLSDSIIHSMIKPHLPKNSLPHSTLFNPLITLIFFIIIEQHQ